MNLRYAWTSWCLEDQNLPEGRCAEGQAITRDGVATPLCPSRRSGCMSASSKPHLCVVRASKILHSDAHNPSEVPFAGDGNTNITIRGFSVTPSNSIRCDSTRPFDGCRRILMLKRTTVTQYRLSCDAANSDGYFPCISRIVPSNKQPGTTGDD